MATLTKKIRILQEFVDKGLGEQDVLKVLDEWSFLPEEGPNKLKVRINVTVHDALIDYKEQKGIAYTTLTFKDLVKTIKNGRPILRIGFFEDTYKKFKQKYPEYIKKYENEQNYHDR